MVGCKVQWCVISTVHHINTSSSHDEHVNHAAPSFSASPVKWAEAVVVTKNKEAKLHELLHVLVYVYKYRYKLKTSAVRVE